LAGCDPALRGYGSCGSAAGGGVEMRFWRRGIAARGKREKTKVDREGGFGIVV
jgi:hypothetical protein